MLVSHRKRFIYTKTIKTAGTSVEVFFEPYCMNDGEWKFTHGRPEYVSEAGIVGARGSDVHLTSKWWNHMPAEKIKAQTGDDIWNSYFKFCVIRNPFDKAVSAYHFFTKQAAPGSASQLPLKDAFEAWLLTGQLPNDRNIFTINNELCVDDVIRYENLAGEIERVCGKLAIPFNASDLPRLKTGGRPPVPLKEYYSPRSIEIVSQTYGYELEKFGYTLPF